MCRTEEIVNYCNQRTKVSEIMDFPGSHNGLQVSNSGEVKKVGAAVDAGLIPFQKAVSANIDFLINHH